MTELDKALDSVRSAKQHLARCVHNQEVWDARASHAIRQRTSATEETEKAKGSLESAIASLRNVDAEATIETDDPGTIPARIRPDSVEKQEDEDDGADADAKASNAFASLQERLQS